MIQLLTTAPATYSVDQLLAEARSAFPDVIDVGEYGPTGRYDLALYLPDDSKVTEQEWADLVAAHVPAPPQVEHPTGYIAAADLVAAVNAAPNTIAGIKAALRSLGGAS